MLSQVDRRAHDSSLTIASISAPFAAGIGALANSNTLSSIYEPDINYSASAGTNSGVVGNTQTNTNTVAGNSNTVAGRPVDTRYQ